MERLPSPLVCLTVAHAIDDISVVEALLADSSISKGVEECIPRVLFDIFGVRLSAGEIIKYLKILWNATRKDDTALLELASSQGLTPLVRYLIKDSTDKHVLEGLLTAAAKNNRLETMRVLIDMGANSCDRALLNATIEANHPEALRLLIAASGGFLPYRADTISHHGATLEPLIVAAARLDSLDMIKQLVAAKANPSSFDVFNRIGDYLGTQTNGPIVAYLKDLGITFPVETFFYNAVASGDVPAMKELAPDIWPLTPAVCREAVRLATQTREIGALQYLKEIGCTRHPWDTNDTDNLAAAVGDLKLVQSSIVTGHRILTMLWDASAGGQVEVVKVLILAAPDDTIRTAISFALTNDHPIIVKLLLDAMIEHKLAFDGSQCDNLATLITDAAIAGHAETVQTILLHKVGRGCTNTVKAIDHMLTRVLDEFTTETLEQTDDTLRSLLTTMAVLILADANPSLLTSVPDETGRITKLLTMSRTAEWLKQYVENEIVRMRKLRKPVIQQTVP